MVLDKSVLLSKYDSVERCIKMARDLYAQDTGLDFKDDYNKQAGIFMYLHWACQTCLDVSAKLIRVKKLGRPDDVLGNFGLLRRAGVIDRELEKKMNGAVGFRNAIVHRYTELDLNIAANVIEKDCDDLLVFIKAVMDFCHETADKS